MNAMCVQIPCPLTLSCRHNSVAVRDGTAPSRNSVLVWISVEGSVRYGIRLRVRYGTFAIRNSVAVKNVNGCVCRYGSGRAYMHVDMKRQLTKPWS